MTGAIIPGGLGAPRQPETFVIVTHYRRALDRPAVIHVYGPYPTRYRAQTVMDRMREMDESQHGERAELISYWVRKMLPESPVSARAGRQGAP